MITITCRRRENAFRFLSILCLALTTAPSSVSAQSSDSSIDAASLCTAFQDNLRAIEAFDVLIRTEVIWTGLEGDIEQTESTIRLIWQAEPERCFAMCRRRQSGIVEEKELPQLSQTTALVYDGKMSYARHNQSGVVTYSFDSGRLLSTLSDIPSIHFIGVAKYPESFMPNYWGTLNHIYALFGPTPTRRYELSGNSTVSIRDERLQSTDLIRFDLAELVPLSIVGYFHPSVGEKFVRWRESYEFQKKSEIRVPTRISGEARHVRSFKGIKKRGHDLYDVELIWRSINEPVNDEVFARDKMEDLDHLLKMLTLEESAKP